MSKIVVKQDAHDLGVVNPVGCLIQGIDVQTDTHQLDEDVNKVEESIRKNPNEILDKDEVKGFNELFSRIGYPEQTTAGEQLVEIIRKKGLNRHNNIVDAYNIAGAEFGSSLGMHDASYIDGDVVVQQATGGERMLPIFHEEEETAQPGDLLCRTDSRVLALHGPVDRQSEKSKVTDTTDKGLLLALGNSKTSEEYNQAVCQRAYELISTTCPDAEMKFLDIVHEDKDRLAVT
jgi:DNA/RNA-binding domain of Phe-tRNA-synthetase-like protein